MGVVEASEGAEGVEQTGMDLSDGGVPSAPPPLPLPASPGPRERPGAPETNLPKVSIPGPHCTTPLSLLPRPGTHARTHPHTRTRSLGAPPPPRRRTNTHTHAHAHTNAWSPMPHESRNNAHESTYKCV